MAISPEEALSLVDKLEAIAANPESILGLQNDLLRQRLREAGRKVSHAMEITIDTARRLQSSVSTCVAINHPISGYTPLLLPGFHLANLHSCSPLSFRLPSSV